MTDIMRGSVRGVLSVTVEVPNLNLNKQIALINNEMFNMLFAIIVIIMIMIMIMTMTKTMTVTMIMIMIMIIIIPIIV